MNRPRQMVIDSQLPIAPSDHGFSCVPGCTGFLPSTGGSQSLPGLQRRRMRPAGRHMSRHRAARYFSKAGFRSAVDCLAMAVCVLFAALVTILLGL